MNVSKDWLFLYSPIWIFALLLPLSIFTHEEKILIAAVLFLLAEPHFAATFPLIFDKRVRDFKINFATEDGGYEFGWLGVFVLMPIFLLMGFSALFIWNVNIAILFFLVVNVFHVTRQSVGVFNIFSRKYSLNNAKLVKLVNLLMYGSTIICTTHVLFRTQNLASSNLLETLFALILLCWLVCTFVAAKASNFNWGITGLFFLASSPGLLMYTPTFFGASAIEFIVIGVSMHYLQYLYLAHKILKGRGLDIEQGNLAIGFNFADMRIYYAFIGVYSVFAISMLYFGGGLEFNSIFVLIPMLFSLYHFYIDAFIWRGAIKSNREMSLKYV